MTESNGNCEYELKTSEQRGLITSFLRQMPSATRLKMKWKDVPVVWIVSTVLLITSINVAVSVGVLVTKLPCPTTIVLSCPSKWVGYEGKCYYFSESEGTWNSSQSNCSASDASLVKIEDQKEMNFIMQHKRATHYWIGLKRKEGQPWEWADGSIFNDWFRIGADGFCAYLNDEKASSTWCNKQRNWICSSLLHRQKTF